MTSLAEHPSNYSPVEVFGRYAGVMAIPGYLFGGLPRVHVFGPTGCPRYHERFTVVGVPRIPCPFNVHWNPKLGRASSALPAGWERASSALPSHPVQRVALAFSLCRNERLPLFLPV
ncbi:hypothetical protein K435DRAFT_857026 [Dendrothele bispora CBS 962.96]|uniref:Uncharacterized protein n=1 Tax=Dendrothele bispora (strain CBS 962.96) TaxID=1314807 RepID=A0A4S8M7H7_DENBC|nr:hypothetical protein K435DRAFT_857026 [Dendrothele bispora CBS 962.96]